MKTLICFFTLLLIHSVTYAETSTGELELRTAEGRPFPSLLLNTHIDGEVSGLIARIRVEQNFKNDSDQWVNGKYHFPLPEGAAIDSLVVKIGERTIRGVVKEKQEAKRTFEQAKKQGKKAGLLQQHRPNMFSIEVANIAPYEEVSAHLTFVDTVLYQNKEFSLRLPTTFTPRYVPNGVDINPQLQRELEKQLQAKETISVQGGQGWARAVRPEDADEVTPPQRYAEPEQVSNRFSIDLRIRAGINIERFIASHAINEASSGDLNQISLAQGSELMNSDFILRWIPAAGTAPQAAFFEQRFTTSTGEEQYYSLMMLSPPTISTQLSIPRDVTFIIDSSGSMAGTSINQAKLALMQGLDSLTPNDRFNLVDFDSSFRTLYQQSQYASADHLAQAKKMVDRLDASGGTEMLGAMQFAMQSQSDPTFLKQIIFITDGAVGYEHDAFKAIAEQLGDARLFTVGIGSAPNTYFMSKAAGFGRGTYTYIKKLDEVSEKMSELFAKLTQPVMRDIQIDWGQEVEQFPQKLPDLYSGEPIIVVAKSKQPIGQLVAKGAMLNTPWQQPLSNNSQSQSQSLDTVWARQKISDLMDKLIIGEWTKSQAKAEILPLSLEHQILSKFAAFVAVEERISRPQDQQSRSKNAPNLMPKGSTMPIPQTATPATLFTLMGLLLLLVSRLFGRRVAA